MERGQKQSFVRCSLLHEVNWKKSDKYELVVRKICDVMELSDSSLEDISLLTCRGLVIKSDPIEHLGKNVDWTIRLYLLKKHVSPEKLTLRVGILSMESSS